MQNLRIRDPGPVRGGGRQAISAEWANRMRDCVMALARVIPQQTRKPAEWTPKKPFEVTANGDDTVTVAAGEIIEFAPQTSGSVPNIPFKGETTAYAGTNSFLVSASGTLYVVLNVVDVPYSDDSSFGVSMTGFSVDSLSLAVDPALSGDQISFPIAELTLTDGVVSVDKQILTYNPTLQLGYIFVYVP